jgi:hypothetical protein
MTGIEASSTQVSQALISNPYQSRRALIEDDLTVPAMRRNTLCE